MLGWSKGIGATFSDDRVRLSHAWGWNGRGSDRDDCNYHVELTEALIFNLRCGGIGAVRVCVTAFVDSTYQCLCYGDLQLELLFCSSFTC